MSGIASDSMAPAGWPEALTAPRTTPPAAAPFFWRGAPWLAVAFVAIVVARLHEVIPALQKFRPALVASATLGVVLVLSANRESWRRILGLTATQLMLAYAAWGVITVPFAFWPGFAFTTVRGLLPMLAMFLAVVMCRPTPANVDRVLLGWVVALACFAVGSLVWGERVAFGRLGGVGATYDPNDMATVMAVGFTFALGLLGRVRGGMRLVVLGCAAALVVAVSESASRGGTVALSVGAMVFVAGQRGTRRLVYVAALGLAAVSVWLNSGPVFRERVTSLLTFYDDYNVQDARSGRIAVWKRGATYLLEHPILGVGAGNFETAEGAWLESQGAHGKWSAAHNTYLQAFVDLGVVGGGILVSLLALSGWRARRLWRPPRSHLSPSFHRPEFLAALLAFCVGALFLSLAYSGILLGLIAVITLAAETGRAQFDPRGSPVPPTPRVGRAW